LRASENVASEDVASEDVAGEDVAGEDVDRRAGRSAPSICQWPAGPLKRATGRAPVWPGSDRISRIRPSGRMAIRKLAGPALANATQVSWVA